MGGCELMFQLYLQEYFQRSYCMSRIPAIIPVSDLRKDAAQALGMVRESTEPIVITQRGRAAAVLLSIDAYETATRELQMLRLLAAGDAEMAAGEGRDLEDVLAAGEALLLRGRA